MERLGREQAGPREAGHVDPEDQRDADGDRDVREVVQEEERAGHRPLSNEGPADRLGEDREEIEEPGPLRADQLALHIPHHHVAGPAAYEEHEQKHQPRDPGEGPRTPRAILHEHPEGVDRDGHDGEVGDVPMQATDPTPGEDLCGDSVDRLVRGPDPVEQEQVKARHHEDQEAGHDEGAAVVQRIVAGGVERVERRVSPGERRASQALEGSDRFAHERGVPRCDPRQCII